MKTRAFTQTAVIILLTLISLTAFPKSRPSSDPIVLAVYPLDTRSVGHRLSPALSPIVRSELSRSDKLEIIPEDLFYTLIDKQDMQASDFYDQRQSQVQLGRMLKADHIVVGSVAQFGNKYLFSLEAVDVATGKIVKSVNVEAPRNSDRLTGLIRKGAAKLREYYDPTPIEPEKPKDEKPRIGHVKVGLPPKYETYKKVALDKKPAHVLEGHRNNVHAVTYSTDGELLFSGATDSSIRVWDAETGDLMRVLKSHTETVLSLATSPDDDKYLISGSRDDSAILWDLQNMVPLKKFDMPGDVHGAAFSPDGKRIALAGGGSIHLYQMFEKNEGEIDWKLMWGTRLQEVLSLAYSPDGSVVAAGNEYGRIVVLDADSGKELARIDRGEDMREVRVIAFDPYNRLFLSGSDDDLAHVWSPKGIETDRLAGHIGDVNAAAFSRGGSLIWTGGNDNKVRAWSPVTGESLCEKRVAGGDVLSIAARPGRDQVAVAARDSKVYVYDFEVVE